MEQLTFKGFGGVTLAAEAVGDSLDPAILLVHGPGHTRAIWANIRSALAASGWRVIDLELRGHGASERPASADFTLETHVEDLRAVLAQLPSRPTIVAAALGGWIAVLALAGQANDMAAGLVLVDVPLREDLGIAADLAQRLHAAPSHEEVDARALVRFGGRSTVDALIASASQLTLPVLVVRGGLSWMQRSPASYAFDAALPDAETAEVVDADLLVVIDRAEAFLAKLLDFLERRQTRRAREFRVGSDARTLRDAMGCFATGITVVTTTGGDGQPIGMTANSFTSLSLDPPLLLVCIATRSANATIFRNAENFGVNLLQTSQQRASIRFASPVEDRFDTIAWRSGESGAPLLKGSLVSLECRRHAIHEGGDHFILVGDVIRAEFEPRRDPLLYFRGKYRRLHLA
jgi:flavin reductase (DIM6/NTAB) family NADH-FMN oxidoreductase RutF/pimeloyl-ACP methyl ester carboxylesterase